MNVRNALASVLILLGLALPMSANPDTESYQVKLAVYPGDDPGLVAKRLAAMYRGTLETAVNAAGEFTISLAPSGAELLRRDPAVEAVETTGGENVGAQVASATAFSPVTNAATTSWSLGNYAYDGAGNIRKIGAEFYVYDKANRLIVSGDAPSTTVTHKQTYTYDGFGNLKSVTTAGAPQTNFTVSRATNQISTVSNGISTSSTTYDVRGNVVTSGTATYGYDPLDVMTESTVDGVTRYSVYSASDERIGTVEGGRSEWTIRDSGGQVLRRLSREASGEWKWQEDYIYRGSQMLAARVPDTAKVRHFHLDHLGTPRLITGNGGVELSRQTYHPFGVEIAPSSAASREKKQFTGHERDAESLDYMHARFYAPYWGRFLSVDPTWESAHLELPQSWNRYSYVMNNPMRFTDPTGKKVECHTIPATEDQPEQVICTETVDVEGEEPEVEPEPEPEPQQAGFLPLDFGNIWDRVTHEAENLKHLTADDLSFRHAPREDFGQCIENNSFSNVYTAAGHTANAALNMAVGSTGRVGVGGVAPHATTWQHKLASGFGGNASRIGRAAGRGAIVLTVFEGFYDIGTIGRCGALAAMR